MSDKYWYLYFYHSTSFLLICTIMYFLKNVLFSSFKFFSPLEINFAYKASLCQIIIFIVFLSNRVFKFFPSPVMVLFSFSTSYFSLFVLYYLLSYTFFQIKYAQKFLPCWFIFLICGNKKEIKNGRRENNSEWNWFFSPVRYSSVKTYQGKMPR